MKRFSQNFAWGGVIGFVVVFVINMVALSLGGTFRGEEGNRMQLTLPLAFQAALMASLFLGFFGAAITLAKDYFTGGKSETDEQ